MNDSQLINSINNCDPWQDIFEEPLRAHKFLEPKKAWQNFSILSSQSNFSNLDISIVSMSLKCS